MKLSICTITAREEPRYDWLVAGIAEQAKPDDEIELVVIDFFGRPIRMLVTDRQLEQAPAIWRIVTTMPKPNPWQGPSRVTSRNLHAIANARNTALCLATHDYVAFLDDRCKLGPRWLETVREGERTRVAALAGPCDRIERVGRSIDDRKERAPLGMKNCGGGWFYGGNFALPLAWALEVNGCEEATDPVGRQDRVMGLMLGNVGRRIDFVPAMGILQDRKIAEKHPFLRVNKGKAPGDKATVLISRFGKLKRTSEFTPDLSVLRELVAHGEPFPEHDFVATTPDWYDGKPIGQMGAKSERTERAEWHRLEIVNGARISVASKRREVRL